MANTTKRAWKLQEFVAHGGTVNCLALGHKSGRVMVTGGEDRKVNMWAVGTPNCIMSLSGHTSPVEAVRFGNAEEMVVAGSRSGALKIWDLEAAKIVRTLTGHKSNIRSLDFHPYGDFVASCSLDTNIKLWDIRRKGCIFTYKGHQQAVNCLRFSPDGRWVASGADDNLVKIWDLTAGKLLNEFKFHTAAVSSIAFHPNEFLLASVSADRTAKFVDLETFELVSSSEPDSTGFRTMCFHPEGTCLYVGAQDCCKVFGWEPAVQHDSVVTGWGKVADVAMAQNQLIGASMAQTNVCTFVVDIQRVRPLGGGEAISINRPQASERNASGRRSFIMERPHTASTKQQTPARSAPEEPEGPDEPEPGDADISDPKNYREIFASRSKLAHSPPRSVPPPFPAPPDDGLASVAPTRGAIAALADQKLVRARSPASRPESGGKGDHQSPRKVEKPAAKETSTRPEKSASNGTAKPSPSRSNDKSSADAKTDVKSTVAAPSKAPERQRQKSAAKEEPKPADGLDFKDFMPKQAELPQTGGSQGHMSEPEALSSILKGHECMMTVLSCRQRNLQIVRALWTSGNTKTAIDSAVGMRDLAIVVDLLNILIHKDSLWNLDICALLLPQVKELLCSKYDNYNFTGCAALKLVLKNFAAVIKNNMNQGPQIGVDISREERRQKCKECHNVLTDIRKELDPSKNSKMANRYRELNLLMAQLD